jgi:hypothetical protein
MYAHKTLKPVEVILRREVKKRENVGNNEPNQGIIKVYMEIS